MEILQQILDFFAGDFFGVLANALIVLLGLLKFIKAFAPLTKWTWDDDAAIQLEKIIIFLEKLSPKNVSEVDEMVGELKKAKAKPTFFQRLIKAA